MTMRTRTLLSALAAILGGTATDVGVSSWRGDGIGTNRKGQNPKDRASVPQHLQDRAIARAQQKRAIKGARRLIAEGRKVEAIRALESYEARARKGAA